MLNISANIEEDIRRRVADGQYSSADELLRLALRALDDSHVEAQAWLEGELLRGLEGDDVEMTPDEWADIRREAEGAAGLNLSS